MKTQGSLRLSDRSFKPIVAVICAAAILVPAYSVAYAQEDQAQAPAANEEAPPIPAEQLDSLIAPIALYPDALLAQTLAASTYPLEVMQLDQWMEKNKNLKDKALADAVAKQPWDPSVQAMAAFPEVVQRMAENIQWMTDLGNAVLAQQKDVMDAVQRMRAKAQGTGNLKTSSEQKVETKTTQSGQQVIVVEQANPEAVYVPSYDPQVVYGAAPAEYPYYPYSYPGYQPGTALAWGTAIAVGGAWAHNNWGNCNWEDGDVTINNNNNFNQNYNKNKNINKSTATGKSGSWQHNPQHRGNAPYANKQTANKYGGKTRGETGASGASTRAAGGGAGARTTGGAGTRPDTSGNLAANRASGGQQGAGTGNRPDAGAGKANASGGHRPGGGAGAKPAIGGGSSKPAKSSGGGNNVGNRSVSSGSSGNAFGGAGSKRSSAKAASNRGGASMKGGGGGKGGGAKAGGGGRGGGGKGAGGGRRR